jgi:hypothetical protein
MKPRQGILETSQPLGTPVQQSPEEATSDGRVPLMLGVTGAWQVDRPEEVKRMVAEEMRTLKEHYPDTPFVILSALAEGIDQIVAQAALDILDAQLFVPLPMSLTAYQEGFKSEASKQTFRDLIDAATSVIKLDHTGAADSNGMSGTRRDVRYTRTAAFIADRCQILFVLHDERIDERDGNGRVGTATIVDWVEDGHIPLSYLPTESQDRPFYYPNEAQYIQLDPRTREANRTEDVYGAIAPSLQRIDEFNAEVVELPESAIEQSKALMRGAYSDHSAFERASVAALMQRYAHADALAVELKRRFLQWLRSIYALSAAAIIAFPLIEVWVYAMVFSFFLGGCALAAAAWTRHRDIENRYLHARALAEGLRIATFWTLAGLPDHVHDHYINKYVGHLAWTRLALQNVETVSRMGMQSNAAADYDLVEDLWVDNQCRYFRRSCAETQSLARWLDGGANLLLGLVLVYAVGLFGYLSFGSSWVPGTIQLLAIGIEMPLALAVSLKAYKSKLGLDPLLHHYEKARHLFEMAQRALRSHHQPGGAHSASSEIHEIPPRSTQWALLVQLGREAILENGEWLWMNQSRDIETPAL